MKSNGIFTRLREKDKKGDGRGFYQQDKKEINDLCVCVHSAGNAEAQALGSTVGIIL